MQRVRPFAAPVLMLMSLTACASTRPGLQHYMDTRDRLNAAKQPDIKTYWQAAEKCASKSEVRKALDAGSDAQLKACMGEYTAKQVASLRTRAQNEKDDTTRDGTLRIARCIELANARGAVGSHGSLENCAETYPLREETAKKAAASERASAWIEAEKNNTPDAWLAYLGKYKNDSRASRRQRA
jgi:hypothetical protein